MADYVVIAFLTSLFIYHIQKLIINNIVTNKIAQFAYHTFFMTSHSSDERLRKKGTCSDGVHLDTFSVHCRVYVYLKYFL